MTTPSNEQPLYTELIPRPDPSKLTDAAIERATAAYRRELDALRELLSERIITEQDARNTAIKALHDVGAQRIKDLDASIERRFALVAHLPDQVKADRHNEMTALRELLETRLAAMDKATELLAADLRLVPSTLEERLRGLRELIEERLDAMDKATDLRLRAADQLPVTVAEMIDQLRKLHEERFGSIVQQFAERDTRGEQEKKASKEALDAALLAQKESVSQQNDANTTAATKTETNFTKQIDLVGSQITALDKSLTDRISELKERIDRGEGSVSGASTSDRDTLAIQQAQFQAEQTRLQSAQTRMQMYALVIAALVVAVGLYTALHKPLEGRP